MLIINRNPHVSKAAVLFSYSYFFSRKKKVSPSINLNGKENTMHPENRKILLNDDTYLYDGIKWKPGERPQ